MKKAVVNFLKGIIFGVTNVIPGVSGGTIAVVIGIFDDMIDAVNHIFRRFRKSVLYLLPIVLGAAVGILVLSNVISWALERYSFPACMFFAGLVVGSVPFIWRRAKKQGTPRSCIPAAVIAFAAVVVLSFIQAPEQSATGQNAGMLLMARLFFGGMLASAAMVIPGISGSFIMILLGLYPVVIGTLVDISSFLIHPSAELFRQILSIVIPLGIGILLGILFVCRLIAWLFQRWYSISHFAVLGLIAGSLVGLLSDPLTWSSGVGPATVVAGIITLVAGFLVSWLISRI